MEKHPSFYFNVPQKCLPQSCMRKVKQELINSPQTSNSPPPFPFCLTIFLAPLQTIICLAKVQYLFSSHAKDPSVVTQVTLHRVQKCSGLPALWTKNQTLKKVNVACLTKRLWTIKNIRGKFLPLRSPLKKSRSASDLQPKPLQIFYLETMLC